MRRCHKITEVVFCIVKIQHTQVVPIKFSPLITSTSYDSLQVWERNQNTCFSLALNMRFVTFQKQNTHDENSPNRFKIFHTINPSIFLTTIRACIARKYCLFFFFFHCYDNWPLTGTPAALFFSDLSIIHQLLLAPYCISGFKKSMFLNYVGINTWVLNYSKLSNLLYPVPADLHSMLAVLEDKEFLLLVFGYYRNFELL